MLEHIYVTAQGEVAKTIFDGIAAFFNAGHGKIFYWVIGMIGTFVIITRIVTKQDLKGAFIWMLSFVILATILIDGRRDVLIHDQTKPLARYAVDNVPLGLTLPVSASTGIASYLTDKLESVMHIPNDASYEKTGMIWGSTLFSQSREVRVKPELLNGWARFLSRCAWLDIKVRHKYTFDDLANANDIFAFLEEKTIAPDGIGYARVHLPGSRAGEPDAEDFPRCMPALLHLKKEFEKSALFHSKKLAQFDATALTKGISSMQSSLESTYNQFFGLSTSTQRIMMQNLAMNAVREGFQYIPMAKNHAAAALNYSKTQGQMSRTSSWASVGIMAQEYVPMLHTILMLLICCAFIPMVYMAFFPTYTMNILAKYVGSFIWLATWPMFFVFINFIMNTILSTHLSAYTGGFGGLTISNIDATEALTWRYSSLTGYLLAFVPYISRMLLSGASNTMMGVATSMMQHIDHDAARGAQGMAEGNYNLFNTSVANHSMNNIGAHHQEMMRRERLFGSSHQLMSGVTETETGRGDKVYDLSGSIDKQPFSITTGERVSSGLSETQSRYEKLAASENAQFHENYTAGLNQLTQAGNREALNRVQQNSQTSSSVASLAEHYENILDTNTRFSEGQVTSDNSGWYQDIGGEVRLGTGKTFKFFGADGHYKTGETSGGSDVDSASKDISFAEANACKRSMDAVQNATQADIDNLEKAMGLSKDNSFASSFNKAFGFNKSAQKHSELAEQAGEAANYAKNHEFGFTTDQMPAFREFLDNKYSPDQVAKWMGDHRTQNDPLFKAAQSEFVQENSNMYLDWYRQHAAQIKENTQTDITDRTQAVTEGKDKVMAVHKSDNKAVAREAQIYEDARVMENLKNRGKPLQSNAIYDYITYKTMADMGLYKPGATSKIPPKPENYEEAIRSPNMELLNNTKANISEKGAELLSQKDTRTQEIQQRIDEGSSRFKTDKNSFNIAELNKKAAMENQKLAKEAWDNLWGKKK